MTKIAPVYWDNQTVMPLGMDLNQLLYAIRQGDNGLILDSCSFSDIYEDSDGVLGLDAMVTPFANIERKMATMRRVLDAQVGALKVSDMGISNPFTQAGTVNVVVRFLLSDGQTISAYFHNPDTTPKKVLPTDEMISWKWLINKKDVTIVVAPEKGVDLNVRQVAARLMKLAENNSPAFLRANTKIAENAAKKAALQDEITALEGELQIAKNELDGLLAKKALGDAPMPTAKLRDGTDVYADESGPMQFATEALAKAKAEQLGGDVYKMPRGRGFYIKPVETHVDNPINEESAKIAFSNYEDALEKVQKESATRATGKDLTVAKKEYEKAKHELNKQGQWMLDKAKSVLLQIKESVNLPAGYEIYLNPDNNSFNIRNIEVGLSNENQFGVDLKVLVVKPETYVRFIKGSQIAFKGVNIGIFDGKHAASAKTYDELASIIIASLNDEIDRFKASLEMDAPKTLALDKEFAELEKLIGQTGFGDAIDALIEKIDQAGTMTEHEPRLLELDRLNANAIANKPQGLNSNLPNEASSPDSAKEEWELLGRVEKYGNTGKFIAVEHKGNKKIAATGMLEGDHNPTLYDKEEDAINAIKERVKLNKHYADPKIAAEIKAANEKMISQMTDKAIGIAGSLTNLPSGFSAKNDGSKIVITGKFDKDVHSRLKRMGASLLGAGYSKKSGEFYGDVDFENASWSISVNDAENLNEVLGRAKQAIAKKAIESQIKQSEKEKFKAEKNTPIFGVTFQMKDEFKKEFNARWDNNVRKWHVDKDQEIAAKEWVAKKTPKPEPKPEPKKTVTGTGRRSMSDYDEWVAQEEYGETRGETFAEYKARKYREPIIEPNRGLPEDY